MSQNKKVFDLTLGDKTVRVSWYAGATDESIAKALCAALGLPAVLSSLGEAAKAARALGRPTAAQPLLHGWRITYQASETFRAPSIGVVCVRPHRATYR